MNKRLLENNSLIWPPNKNAGDITKKWKNILQIREAKDSEFNEVYRIESQAFGYEKEAELVKALLNDPTAEPTLSLLAFRDESAVGHILFTSVQLINTPERVSAYILAPLAVLPGVQNQGIGGKLIERGLEILSESGGELVFVLGHPGYYPRYGFQPAGVLGFTAPYPIPDIHANAWMVQELSPGIIGSVRGEVVCADSLNKPEHWRE